MDGEMAIDRPRAGDWWRRGDEVRHVSYMSAMWGDECVVCWNTRRYERTTKCSLTEWKRWATKARLVTEVPNG